MAPTTETITPVPAPNLAIAEEWEQFLRDKYPKEEVLLKKKEEFRDYEKTTRPSVRTFYQLNHEKQTLDFVLSKKKQFSSLNRLKMTIWEAMEYLNQLVDDSDPDTSLSQIEHLLQTAEALRRDGHPRWMILTGLIHDLGKILCIWAEEQWAVVGDTFPVGCAYSDKVVFHEFFNANPDKQRPELQTKSGIYSEHCGLDNVHMSWGHDEYLYMVVKDYLPEEALYIIRYHSFYACHRENDYQYLMNEKDHKMFEWVRKFNPYDLYSKADAAPNVEELKPYYMDLINEYFPGPLNW